MNKTGAKWEDAAGLSAKDKGRNDRQLADPSQGNDRKAKKPMDSIPVMSSPAIPSMNASGPAQGYPTNTKPLAMNPGRTREPLGAFNQGFPAGTKPLFTNNVPKSNNKIPRRK